MVPGILLGPLEKICTVSRRSQTRISPLGQGPRVFPGWAAKWAQTARWADVYALGLGARGIKVVVFGERRLRKQGLLLVSNPRGRKCEWRSNDWSLRRAGTMDDPPPCRVLTVHLVHQKARSTAALFNSPPHPLAMCGDTAVHRYYIEPTICTQGASLGAQQ